MEEDYSKRELDEKFKDFKEQLDRIETQTTKHNGRMQKVERVLLIVGTAVAVLLITNGSQFIVFLKGII